MSFAPGATVGGRWRLEAEIGRGAMGHVWRAVDARTGERVAVKVLSEERVLDTESRARFEREARLAGRVTHPNIVRVLDAGHADDVPFIVMELARGETLAALLAREAPLAPARAVRLLADVAAALAAAHAAGLVHRDVKPSNVMVEGEGEAPRAKLLDFGVAKHEGHALTGTNQVVGTMAYMAPEQTTAARDVTPAADVWSLGVIAYEALTGVRPFEAERFMALMHAIRHAKYTPASQVSCDLAPEVDGALARALARDPTARPTAPAFVRDLAAALGVAMPATKGRRPALAIGLGVLCAASIVAVAIAARSRPTSAVVGAPAASVAAVVAPAETPGSSATIASTVVSASAGAASSLARAPIRGTPPAVTASATMTAAPAPTDPPAVTTTTAPEPSAPPTATATATAAPTTHARPMSGTTLVVRVQVDPTWVSVESTFDLQNALTSCYAMAVREAPEHERRSYEARVEPPATVTDVRVVVGPPVLGLDACVQRSMRDRLRLPRLSSVATVTIAVEADCVLGAPGRCAP